MSKEVECGALDTEPTTVELFTASASNGIEYQIAVHIHGDHYHTTVMVDEAFVDLDSAQSAAYQAIRKYAPIIGPFTRATDF